jgi:exodeoxyribonuclease V alpha subunit
LTAEITMLVGSVFPGPRGGAVFIGRDQSGRRVRAVADRAHICRAPQRGEAWRLQGTFTRHPQFGDQLQVARAWLLKPDGPLIAHYLTHHPAFRGIGIGPAKVARLRKTFGDALVAVLDQGDVDRLSQILDHESAGNLIQRWQENAKEASVVAFLDAHGADVRLASRVLRYWPDRTVEKLRENPYRLLFLTGWSTVDRIATSLGVRWDDERRLIAAVESVVYTLLHSEKDTRIDAAALQAGVMRLIDHRDQAAARRAIELAAAEGTIVGNQIDGYQAFGCAVMERFLALRFQELMESGVRKNSVPGSVAPIEDNIISFERANSISLDKEQRSAAQMAMTYGFSILHGGAGVGKTTALKAVGAMVEARHGRVIQMALAGRAAQRMREATGREAFTITAILNQIKQGRLTLGDDDLVVVDESSMLDLILVYRLMRALPERVRLLLVGDPFQLPPIGPGLVFHILAASDSVPQQELTQVHRQTEGSGIPAIAKEIRDGRVATFGSFGGPARGVALVETPSRDISRTVIDVMRSLAVCGEVQILGVTKRGDGGTETLNATIHELVAAEHPSLAGWGFAETEPVIHLVNNYDRDLFNGSLGRIRRIISERSVEGTMRQSIECDFDGVTHRFDDDSVDCIALAHAITVHKAQGSQFERVIVPVVRSRLLDRTLIYTALTRAVEQVVFVGDRNALTHAIQAPPHSHKRQVSFRL